ncbi:hypothetical protein Ahia01_000491300, partial [Argonauta hians]
TMDSTYTLHYLGCSTLSKGTTGLGLIQKPLKEHYFNFQKKVAKSPTEVYMKINNNGLDILTPNGSGSTSYLKNIHYNFNLINYMEAVQFTVNKNNSRKTQYAFMPLDVRREIKSPDKLFSTLEKKNNYLLKITHQPIVVCLLRRQIGLKALDCHVFLSLSATDAMKIVDNFNAMQQRSIQSEYMGDFAATTGGAGGGGGGGAAVTAAAATSSHVERRHPRPEEASYRPHSMSPENLSAASGGQPPSHPHEDHRYQLRDEYFRHSQDRHIDHDPRQYGQSPQHYKQHQQIFSSSPSSSPHQGRHLPVSRGSSNLSETGYLRVPDNSKSYPPPSNYGRPMSENIGDFNRQHPNYDERQRMSYAGDLSPRNSRANDRLSYSPGVTRTQNYPSDPSNIPAPTGPMFSLSNLESRQQFDNRNNNGDQNLEASYNNSTKPVAKVPPHKIAGVKVLPSAFELPKRQPSPKASYHDSDISTKPGGPDTLGWEKPDIHYRHNNHDRNSNNRYSNAYAFDSKSHENNGNYLRSSDGGGGDQLPRPARPMSMVSTSDYYKSEIPTMSQNDIYRQYQNQHYPPNTSKHYGSSSSNNNNSSNSSSNYHGGSESIRRQQQQQQYHYNYQHMSGSSPHINQHGSKEAEIAAMFQHMGLDRPHRPPPPGYSRNDVNFEKSLGYFP